MNKKLACKRLTNAYALIVAVLHLKLCNNLVDISKAIR